MEKALKVFVSYKWEDEQHIAWVTKLASDLRSFGIDALLDKWEVRYGHSFTDYMTSAISQSDVVLFIMTPKSVEAAEAPQGKGGAVKFEVQLSTARRIAGENFRFIGVLRRGEKIASHLRDFRYVDFRDEDKYDVMLRSLVNDLLGFDEKPTLGNPPITEKENTVSELKPLNQQSSVKYPPVKTGSVGTYISQGYMYAIPSSLALFSGYLIQTNSLSLHDLFSLSIPISFSVFFYMCHAYKFNNEGEHTISIQTILHREALYIHIIIGLLYSISVYFALGANIPPHSLIYAFGIYIILFISYGIYLLRFRPSSKANYIRHRLIWPTIFSFTINLYYGLSLSSLKISMAPLLPIAILILFFFTWEILNWSWKTIITINLVITFLLIFFSQLKELELFSVPLSQFFSAMSFCICIAVYLLVFDVWRFISDMARDSKGNGIITTTKSNRGHQVQGVFKFSLAASMLLIGIVCILPFYFIFSPYGTVFLIVFAVHAIAAIAFWFRYGNDLKHLQVLPWATIKVLAGTVFLLGLVVASIFNKQPSKPFLLSLSTWTGVSFMQFLITIPLTGLVRSIKRAGWKDRQHIVKVFENRINLVRFLSVVSFVVFFVLVSLLVSIEENSLLHYKGELAVCVYTTFLLLGVVFEILHYIYVPIQAPNNSFSSTPQ